MVSLGLISIVPLLPTTWKKNTMLDTVIQTDTRAIISHMKLTTDNIPLCVPCLQQAEGLLLN